MSITMLELNKYKYDVTLEQAHNLSVLYERMNLLRDMWGNAMIVTSGLRSKEDQMRINPAAPYSKHLLGAACDISDPNGALQAWCLTNVELLEKLGLYCEHFSRTPHWVHFQIFAPASGKRFFYP